MLKAIPSSSRITTWAAGPSRITCPAQEPRRRGDLTRPFCSTTSRHVKRPQKPFKFDLPSIDSSGKPIYSPYELTAKEKQRAEFLETVIEGRSPGHKVLGGFGLSDLPEEAGLRMRRIKWGREIKDRPRKATGSGATKRGWEFGLKPSATFRGLSRVSQGDDHGRRHSEELRSPRSEQGMRLCPDAAAGRSSTSRTNVESRGDHARGRIAEPEFGSPLRGSGSPGMSHSGAPFNLLGTQSRMTFDNESDRAGSGCNPQRGVARGRDRQSTIPSRFSTPLPPNIPNPIAIDSTPAKSDKPGPWHPTRKLTYSAMAGLKTLHEHDPKTFTKETLSKRFGISYEAVSRILRSNYQSKAGDNASSAAGVDIKGTKWDLDARSSGMSPVPILERAFRVKAEAEKAMREGSSNDGA